MEVVTGLCLEKIQHDDRNQELIYVVPFPISFNDLTGELQDTLQPSQRHRAPWGGWIQCAQTLSWGCDLVMKDGRWRMWRTRMAGGNEHISPCFMIFVAPISILSKNSHTYDIQTLHPRFLRLLILEWFPFALRILFFLMSRGSLFQQWIIFSHIKGGPHRPYTKRTVNRKCLCNLCL